MPAGTSPKQPTRLPAVGDKPRGEERAFLGIGSNEGDRRAAMRSALGLLFSSPGISVRAVSSLYRAAPVGYNNQRDFYNGVVEIRTSLSPSLLLRRLKQIEQVLGRRESGPRWGPRVIDLDIILYGSRVVRAGNLVIPHPEMSRRRFVLAPLAEIAPEAAHPVLLRTAAELLADLDDGGEVTRLGKWTAG